MTNLQEFVLTDYALTPELKNRFNEASATLEKLRRRRKKVVRAADAGGITSWLADVLFQHGLYRIVTLADGAIGEWNARRPMNAIILVRSLLESVASWNYVGGKISSLTKQENIREIHQILLKMRFGIRHKLPSDSIDFPTSTNVLTFISSLEKVDAIIANLEAFAPTGGGRKVFRYYYDDMSEFVHPNEAGIGVFGASTDPATMEVHLSEAQPVNEAVVIDKVLHIAVLLEMADKFLDVHENRIHPGILALEHKFGSHPDDWPKAESK